LHMKKGMGMAIGSRLRKLRNFHAPSVGWVSSCCYPAPYF
jgi:hypothetical protein